MVCKSILQLSIKLKKIESLNLTLCKEFYSIVGGHFVSFIQAI